MSKYDYDKSVLSGLKVKPFLHEVETRQKHIEAADDAPSPSIFNANILADDLHPHVQFAKVAEVIDHGSAKEYVIKPNKNTMTKQLAYFRAGQYISVLIEADGITTSRPYTICSSPKDALGEDSEYRIVVKGTEGGLVSNYILNNWKQGSEVVMSGPLGHYFYTDLRDAKHVVALAGGSGITPFYSMAAAVAQGTEDFKLTIIYGSRVSSDILLKDELRSIVKAAKGKIKVIHVLSEEDNPDFEHGFINAELVKKYAGEGDYSVFVCGPPAMYNFMSSELDKLGLPLRRIRFEVPGETLDVSQVKGFDSAFADKKFKVKVHIRGQVQEVECSGGTTLMRSLENAGIFVPADCRSGKCGWCHSRLISGEVFVPKDKDGRRMADAKFGWIHPCSTYPKSDIEMEIFPILI